MNKDDRAKLVKGSTRVVATSRNLSSYYVAGSAYPGMPERKDHFDIEPGDLGTFIKSSADTPRYKIIRWDKNGLDGDIYISHIELV